MLDYFVPKVEPISEKSSQVLLDKNPPAPYSPPISLIVKLIRPPRGMMDFTPSVFLGDTTMSAKSPAAAYDLEINASPPTFEKLYCDRVQHSEVWYISSLNLFPFVTLL